MFRYTSEFKYFLKDEATNENHSVSSKKTHLFISRIPVEYQTFGLFFYLNQRIPCPNLHSQGLSATRTSRLGCKRLILGVMKRDNFCRKPTATARRMEKTIYNGFIDEDVEKAT